jgi:3-oxoacyl-ACP reductase-like protein
MSATNIVLVHGAGADGSCGSGVIRRLQQGGDNVTAPTSLIRSAAQSVAA